MKNLTWPTKKLGEVCNIIPPGVEQFSGGKKYVATADIDFDKIINSTEIAFKNRPSRANMEVKENDVLVAKMAETKKFLVANKKLQNNYIFSTGFAILRAKKDLLPRCLFYFLITKEFNLQKNKFAVGATQKAINNPALKKIKIPLPSLSIQRKIVERLDAIKKTQELNDKQIALVDELFQSLVHRELDPKGKKWEKKKLGEICDVRDGTHESPKFYPSGIPLVTSKNLIEGGVDFENINYISLEDHKEIDKRSGVDDGDILFGMIGTIGNPVIVKKDREFSIKNVGLIKFITSSPINYFIYYSLLGSFVQKQIKIFSRGGTQKFVSLGNLRNLKILVPNRITQKKIVEKLSAVQDYKKKLLEQKQKLQELFDSVLNKSFKGELIR